MIPIRDINPRVRVPIVNYALLALCAVAFLYQLSIADVDGFIHAFAMVPSDLNQALEHPTGASLLAELQAVLTSMFLHGGWFHIIGNLLYLRVFGDNVEDRFGHLTFLLFYLASGLAGALGHYAMDPESTTPMIGASGAIAGVLGAYVILFPTSKIVTLFPIFIFLTFIEVPAFFFLGLWAAQQLLNVYAPVGREGSDQIAWFAHLGGFAFGLIAGIIYRVTKRWRRRRRA